MVDFIFYTLDHDEAGKVIYRGYGAEITNPGKGVPEKEYTADCSLGQSVDSMLIDCSGFDGLEYRVQVMLPGTERCNGGQGLWLRQSGEIYLDFPEHSQEYAH